MLVRDYMTRHPIMVGPEVPVAEAQRLMMENHVRQLPVVGDGKRLIGLVTRQRLAISPELLASLDVWEITRYLSGLTAGKVMITGQDLHTIGPDATLEEAAELLIKHRVGGLPVVEDGDVVVGIITETDLLIELQLLLGGRDAGGSGVAARAAGRKAALLLDQPAPDALPAHAAAARLSRLCPKRLPVDRASRGRRGVGVLFCAAVGVGGRAEEGRWRLEA